MTWPHPTYLSPWTDAYQPAEQELQCARRVVSALSARGFPMFVITKSCLVLRDAELFYDRPKAFIGISLNSLDDALVSRLEPRAPRASERLALLSALMEGGRARTVVKIDPVLPGLTDGNGLCELVETLCALRPHAVTAETLRLSRGIARALEPVLTPSQYAVLLTHYAPLGEEPQHPMLSYRLDLFTRLAARLERSGIRAAFCRASLPHALTPHDCRGGYAA